MGWTAADIPDQRGRVAVVTGGSGGLGLAVSRALARRGALVVMAARDEAKAEAARRSLAAEAPGLALELRALDLASLESVRACAAGIAADHPRVDLLVNNAGVMATPERRTADGFELQLGVNHLGHFALTRRLLPALLSAPAGRVVSVTSFGRLMGSTADADDPRPGRGYGPWRAYGRSKLANLRFAVELQRRLTAVGAGVRSLAAHPGLAHTDLQARSVRASGGGPTQRLWQLTARWVGVSAERGALPLLRAATDADAAGGTLYGPRWAVAGAPVRRPLLDRRSTRDAARMLWELSERATGERFDVAAIVRGG